MSFGWEIGVIGNVYFRRIRHRSQRNRPGWIRWRKRQFPRDSWRVLSPNPWVPPPINSITLSHHSWHTSFLPDEKVAAIVRAFRIGPICSLHVSWTLNVLRRSKEAKEMGLHDIGNQISTREFSPSRTVSNSNSPLPYKPLHPISNSPSRLNPTQSSYSFPLFILTLLQPLLSTGFKTFLRIGAFPL